MLQACLIRSNRVRLVPIFEGSIMRKKLGFGLCMAALPLALLALPALGGEGVSLNVTNDGTEDIVVTVYDTTLGPNAVVLSHVRINGFTTIPLSVAPDATGRANISWTAISADSNDRKCGHADNVGLGDSSSVTVRADSSCGTSQPSATAVNYVP
jgi:hypothetical protein